MVRSDEHEKEKKYISINKYRVVGLRLSNNHSIALYNSEFNDWSYTNVRLK